MSYTFIRENDPASVTPSFNPTIKPMIVGIDADRIIDLIADLRKIGLTYDTAHELIDRVEFADKHGGTIHLTADGPRLDEESEVLFMVGREARS